jgi:two-component system LytT family response regulator|tara:strand:- start:495 stop:848 length:354 start_codon:yes stop_codon:yes gene_type:complete
MREQDSIAVTTMYGHKLVNPNDILFIKGDGSYSVIHFKEGSLMVSKNIGAVAELLRDSNFIRVHKSYIVNADKIKELHREDGGYLILSQRNLLIPLGSDKRKRIVFEYLKSLFNYIK